MFGRTYSLGYEPDLHETLIDAAAADRAQSGLALGDAGTRCGEAASSRS